MHPGVANPAAIVVRGARKSYTADECVLDGLDLTVPNACIYALLGASGCGKTTVLACIMGLRRMDAGSIRVLGWRPGERGAGVPGPRVGYMPQELAMGEGFSVGETIKYFGRVAGLEDDVIESRSNELLEVLNIPTKKDRLISKLSGGQQRRLSLALTLLHAPPLLILDEPTVGVDPVLRQSIWDYLLDLTRTSGTTVLITTHYIEEARQASKVGMMRRGRILDEDSPERMIARNGCSNLEDVFLALSRHQDATKDSKPGKDSAQLEIAVEAQPESAGKLESFQQHSNVMACVWWSLMHIWRYKGMTAFVFLMPATCMLFYLYTVGSEPVGLHLAVVNDDSPGTCQDAWRGYPKDCEAETPANLSCRFIAVIREWYDLVIDEFSTEREARGAVQKGRAWGVVHFPANFSYHMTRRARLAVDAADEDIDGSEVDVHLDMSNHLLSHKVGDALYKTALRFQSDVQGGCGLGTEMSIPIREMEPVYGKREPSFQEFGLPGILLNIINFVAICFAMTNFMEEKLSGVMSRNAAAGVTYLDMLSARLIVDGGIIVSSTVIILFIAFVVFRFDSQGSYWTVTSLLLLQGFGGLWIGYLVAACTSTHFTSMLLTIGTMLGMFFFSGLLWPVQGMHWSIKWMAPLTPMSFSVEAMRSVLFQGSNGHVLALGFSSLTLWSVLLATGTLTVLRLQTRLG